MPVTAQRNWRWCKKCNGLWYSAATANPKGVCPADKNGHSMDASGDYALFGDPDGSFSKTVTAQRNWRWCKKCNGLWYSAATANPNGVCPADGHGHSKDSSGDYALFGDSDGNLGD